jgi:hypothetical protein
MKRKDSDSRAYQHQEWMWLSVIGHSNFLSHPKKGNAESARRQSMRECWSGHLDHPRGRFSVYHIPQLSKSSPIRWIMSRNTHGISDIFITWIFLLAVGWISRQYIHYYFAKIKADFATYIILLMPWLFAMLEWNMGGKLILMNDNWLYVLGFTEPGYMIKWNKGEWCYVIKLHVQLLLIRILRISTDSFND